MKIAMKQVLSAAVMAGALLAMSQAQATTKHFKGEPAETLEQAVTNLATYNAKLAAIVNKDKIEPAEMGEIHQLTYTLENALRKLKAEVLVTEELLEDVHKASETADYEKAQTQGRAYLEKMNTLIH